MNCGTRTDPDVTEVYAVTVMCGRDENSKHWFTTSFFQPLPYLVTPY